jgi:hypothetical protein
VRHIGMLIVMTAMVLMATNSANGLTSRGLLALHGTTEAKSKPHCPPPPPPPPPRSKSCPPCPHDDCRDKDHDGDHDKDHHDDRCGKGNDSNLP